MVVQISNPVSDICDKQKIASLTVFFYETNKNVCYNFSGGNVIGA